MTTSSGPSALERLALIAQEADAERPQLVVDVRIVDDFAGQVNGAVGKPRAGLVGVVHRAVDPVTEPELPGEVEGQAPGLVPVALVLDPGDEVAVIARRELARDRVLEVQTLAENQWWHVLRLYAPARQRPAWPGLTASRLAIYHAQSHAFRA